MILRKEACGPDPEFGYLVIRLHHDSGNVTTVVGFICPTCKQPGTQIKRYADANRRKGRRGPYCTAECAAQAPRPAMAATHARRRTSQEELCPTP